MFTTVVFHVCLIHDNSKGFGSSFESFAVFFNGSRLMESLWALHEPMTSAWEGNVDRFIFRSLKNREKAEVEYVYRTPFQIGYNLGHKCPSFANTNITAFQKRIYKPAHPLSFVILWDIHSHREKKMNRLSVHLQNFPAGHPEAILPLCSYWQGCCYLLAATYTKLSVVKPIAFQYRM